METQIPANHPQHLEHRGHGLTPRSFGAGPRKPSRPPDKHTAAEIKTVNLEEGRPSTHEAVAKLIHEVAKAKKEGQFAIKLIHGYGSSGVGGELRIAIQRRLREMREGGEIKGYVFGEDWSISDETTWKLTKGRPELKRDRDLGKRNMGITIVLP